MTTVQKPIIGITCGDINGIGIELIIKTFSDARMLDICNPVIFASNKTINFYRKTVPDTNFNFFHTRELDRLNSKQPNIFNCWEEEVAVNPGVLNDIGGKYAVLSLKTAVDALRQGKIDGLVTAPIHKDNVQNTGFDFTGHTPFLKSYFQAKDVVMMLCANNMRVALATEHIPISKVSESLTTDIIVRKLQIVNDSLQRDFGIQKPRIAVLGLNPHAGDNGVIGEEEKTIIQPAITQAFAKNILACGPYSSDAFFARGHYQQFDAVLAMYHDQGLIPFKSLAAEGGVNFTAGLEVVRTSPDHGVAFDIAGKGIADHHSFLQAVYSCIDIIRSRAEYKVQRENPLKKITTEVVAKLEDEEIEDSI